MRKINKKIILLSLILAMVMLNNSSIQANSHKRGLVNKNNETIEMNKESIENSLKNNDYDLFINTLKKININESITKEQFTVLVNAYNLFKQNKNDEAIKLLKDNKVNPVLIKFINNNPNMTDAQKEAIKKAQDLIKEGKIEEAKAVISAAGLPNAPAKVEKKINKIEKKLTKEELKKVLEQSRELKKEGKKDEAKKVLKDAGIPYPIQDKLKSEFEKKATTTKGFFNSLKSLFIK